MEDKLIKDLMVESVNKGRSFYDNIVDKGGFHHYELPIDCLDLVDREDKISEKSRKHSLPESLKISFFRPFDLLIDSINSKSCLYFFEFHDISAEVIYNAYKISDNKDRNRSGLKEKPDFNTDVLYVGKVKKNIGARLSTHFGYAHSKTGGLQLKYWAKDIKMKLTVHLIVFDENIGDFINPLELELTKKLNPLIGKSK
jgi:hypothetical protein